MLIQQRDFLDNKWLQVRQYGWLQYGQDCQFEEDLRLGTMVCATPDWHGEWNALWDTVIEKKELEMQLGNDKSCEIILWEELFNTILAQNYFLWLWFQNILWEENRNNRLQICGSEQCESLQTSGNRQWRCNRDRQRDDATERLGKKSMET